MASRCKDRGDTNSREDRVTLVIDMKTVCNLRGPGVIGPGVFLFARAFSDKATCRASITGVQPAAQSEPR